MKEGDIVCPVAENCCDYLVKCESCKHNKGKRSYYAPEYPILNNYERG